MPARAETPPVATYSQNFERATWMPTKLAASVLKPSA